MHVFECRMETVAELVLEPEKVIARSKRRKRRVEGQKRGFDRASVALIRASLGAANDLRGLALLSTSIDTCLRGIDLVALRISDVTNADGVVVEHFTIVQSKTNREVGCC